MDSGAAPVGLEFGVLGPVEVRRNGAALPLGGVRQRALLATLVLHRGEVVSVDRLIENLFGPQPGTGAANALQQAVSRLRRTLGDGGAVVTKAPGYLLDVAPEQVDLWRFEAFRRSAQEAVEAGEAETAVGRLREALALWRGEALSDIADLDWAQADIRRLEELRLATTMDRIDAELAVGEANGRVTELEHLVAANPFQERLRGQLMLALYREGRQADALQAYRDAGTLLRGDLGLEPSRALQELERAILTHDASLDAAPKPLEREDGVAICPFKGLAPFELSDARFFCGRERVVDDLVSRLAEGTIVGIVGPSGIGKSSILRAGLLRALASGALPGSETWNTVVLRPGAHPASELEGIPGTGARTVVAVDQFEELFTVCEDEAERAAFLEALVTAARDPERRTIVTLALRADFYGRCATYPRFAELLSARHALVGPMQPDELVRAITIPAERAGLHVEETLVAALVRDVGGEAGGLPLLQTVLLELWRRREDTTLRLSDYRAVGGVRGAVGRLAEATYERLDDDGRRIARTLMLRLAAGDADNAVRRRVPAAELTQGRVEEEAVLDTLVEGRLLIADDGSIEVAHEALLREWSRMRAWLEEERESRRLEGHVRAAAAEWDDGGREPADLYRGPRLAAVLDWYAEHQAELGPVEAEFVAASREAGDRELVEEQRRNRRLRALAGGIFALLVLALVAGGAALIQRGSARREARVALARQLGAEALTEPRLDRAMLLAREAVNLSPSSQTDGTLLATLLRAPAAISTFSLPITSRPQRLSVSPDGRTLGVADNTGAVRFYDLATNRLRGELTDVGYGLAPLFNPDGSRFVVYAGVRTTDLSLRAARTLEPLATLRLDKQFLANSSCGAQIPVFGSGNTLFLTYCLTRPDGSDGAAFLDEWNLRTGRRTVSARPLGMRGASLLRVLPQGRLLVVGDDKALILDARTLRPRRELRLGETIAPYEQSASDGRTIAIVASDGAVRLVDVPTGRSRTLASAEPAEANSAALSPDGLTLAVGAQDGTVIVRDLSTGRVVDRLTGHATRVLGLVFSPDGKTLYSCSLDGAIFAWDLGTSRRFGLPFGTSTGPGFAVGPNEQSVAPPLAISPGGRRFASRVERTRVGIFATGTATPLEAFDVATGGDVGALAWGRQGLLAVSGDSGHVQLWNVAARPRLVRALRGMGSINKQPEAVTTLAFSPDGSLLAAGDVNHTPYTVPWRYGTTAVWDVASGRLLWKARSKRGWVNTVAFSHDGRWVAAGNETNVVTVYDARSGRTIRTVQAEGLTGYTSVAFAPNGTLATGTWAGIVQLWNPATGREVGEPTSVAAAPVSSIAFSPSGTTFATTGGSDGTAKLWTTSTLQQFGSNLPQAGPWWGNARFTPDGNRLVVVWVDATGSVWPTSTRALEQHACALAGRNFTPTEWRQFVGGRYRTTCPGQPGVSGR